MQTVNFDTLDKATFHSTGASHLRANRAAMGWTADNCNIRSNKGGPAVTGEVIMHHDNLYVMLHRHGNGARLLVRMCRDRKDYSGGSNHYLLAGLLNRPDDCARALRDFMKRYAGEIQ